ncbi:hexosaminidase D isoform 1-T1 [Glossina fuscipes fuscipes]
MNNFIKQSGGGNLIPGRGPQQCSNMFKIIIIWFWRRKISISLLASGIILVGLWSWAYLETSQKYPQSYKSANSVDEAVEDSNQSQSYRNLFVLQKLISDANRVLSSHQNRARSVKRNLLSPSTRTNIASKDSSGSAVVVKEASAQTLSLVARRKKAPVVGESLFFEEERLRILENQQRAKNSAMEDIQMIDEEARTLTSEERQIQYEHELQRMGVPVIAGIGPETGKAPKERLVHLDLKGAPAKITFLKQLLTMLKTLGATGLLIEYEDMFPFEGPLANLSATNAYKKEELKDFLETCALHGFTIMPLVQTFGHLEYALKLQEFSAMREIPESPQSICPSRKESMDFLEELLRQVIEFHLQFVNESTTTLKMTHIHIGCDEVYRIAECSLCRVKLKDQIFLDHVMAMAHFIRSHWQQLNVLIWDDMLRPMSLTKLQTSLIGNYVQPMIWVYTTDIYASISPTLWERYAQVFSTVWAASAFKGAWGESLMIPPLQRHLENNIRWLAVMNKEGGRFSKGFQGLVLTGWQRYDHFAILCELLPAAIPSLITTLSTVSKGYFSTNPKDNGLLKVLQCYFHPDSRRSGHPWIELHNNSHHSQLFSSCSYLGSQFYQFSLRLYDKLAEIQMYLHHVQDKSAWMSTYNLRHNFSSILIVKAKTEQTQLFLQELITLSKEAEQLLYHIYDKYTIGEFVEQHIYPTILALQTNLANATALSQARHWPRRPLPIAQAMYDLQMLADAPKTIVHDTIH